MQGKGTWQSFTIDSQTVYYTAILAQMCITSFSNLFQPFKFESILKSNNMYSENASLHLFLKSFVSLIIESIQLKLFLPTIVTKMFKEKSQIALTGCYLTISKWPVLQAKCNGGSVLWTLPLVKAIFTSLDASKSSTT